MAEVASAFVSLVPSARGFGRDTETALNRELDPVGQRSGSRFGKVLKFGAAAALGIGAFAAVGIQEAVSSASDLNESLNAVNVTFGKNADGIKKLGEQAADSVGLSKVEFNNLAVQFSGFAGVIAGKGGDVVGTLDDLTTRGADFASVVNLDVNEAMGLFQSGLAGETEPLRKFGIDLSAAKVEAFAYSEGIASAGKPLTENQKVQARYALLMKETSKTQGDFSNTSDSLANAQRRLKANVSNLTAELGQMFIPILEKVTGWLVDKVVPAVSKFIDEFKAGVGAGGRFRSALEKVWDGAQVLWQVLKPVIDRIRNFFTSSDSGAATLRDKLVPAVKRASDFFRDKLLPVLDDVWAVFRDHVIPIVRRQARFFRDVLLPEIVKIVNNVRKNLTPALEAFADYVRQQVIPAARKIAAKFKEWQPTIQRVTVLVVKIIGKLADFVSFIFGKVIPAMFKFQGGMNKVVGTAIRTVIGLISSNIRRLADLGRMFGRQAEIAGSFARAVVKKIGEVLNVIQSLPSRAKAALGNLGSTLFSAGAALVQGLINGIISKIQSLKNKIGELAGIVKGAFPGSPVKWGPLTSWNNGGAGKRLVDLLAGGLRDTRPVDSAMTALAARVASGVPRVGVDLSAAGEYAGISGGRAYGRGDGARFTIENLVVRDERAAFREMEMLNRRAAMLAGMP